ncbi:MAG: SRPBCC family protein [Candidatus Limnocylindrales bacterium]
MPSAERSVTIQRPVSTVFAFVDDGLTAPQWRSGVLDIAHVSGKGVGAVYRQGVKGPGGRRVAADYEVTAHEPDSRIGFKAIAGPVRPTGEYRFQQAEGGTRMTFSLKAELSGLQKLLGGAVQKTMDAEMGALDKLKALLESRT